MEGLGSGVIKQWSDWSRVICQGGNWGGVIGWGDWSGVIGMEGLSSEVIGVE